MYFKFTQGLFSERPRLDSKGGYERGCFWFWQWPSVAICIYFRHPELRRRVPLCISSLHRVFFQKDPAWTVKERNCFWSEQRSLKKDAAITYTIALSLKLFAFSLISAPMSRISRLSTLARNDAEKGSANTYFVILIPPKAGEESHMQVEILIRRDVSPVQNGTNKTQNR